MKLSSKIPAAMSLALITVSGIFTPVPSALADPKVTTINVTDTKPEELNGADKKPAADAKSADAKPASEEKAAAAKATDAKAAAAKAAAAKAADAKPADSKSADTKAAGAKASDAKKPDFTVADSYYNEAVKYDPTDLDKAAHLYVAAIAEYDKIGSKNDNYATCFSNLALIELKGNDLAGAEKNIKLSLDKSINPQIVAKNYQMLGDIRARQNNLTEADSCYHGALDIYAKNSDPNNQQATVLEKLATVYDRMGKKAQAAAARSSATDLANFKTSNPEAKTHYKAGTKALIANDYKTAITELEAALKLQPDFTTAKQNLAIAYQHEALENQHKSDFATAESNYLLALPAMESAFGPNHQYTCTVIQGLVETLESEKKLDDAQKYAEKWLGIERANAKSGQPVENSLRAYIRILKANKKNDLAAAAEKELNGDINKEKALQFTTSESTPEDKAAAKRKKIQSR